MSNLKTKNNIISDNRANITILFQRFNNYVVKRVFNPGAQINISNYNLKNIVYVNIFKYEFSIKINKGGKN